MGVSTIAKDLQNEIRRYLFGQLAEADEERLELRLLTEPAFVEEFDTVVDEVTDQYVRDELADSERDSFEKSFLTTAEGKKKLRFASELLDQAGERVAEITPSVVAAERQPGFFDWIPAFWQSQSMRLAATAAAVVIIAGGIFLISKSFRVRSTTYTPLSLSISTSSRADGVPPARVRLESGIAGIQLNLAIPEGERDAKNYRVKLIPGDGGERDFPVEERKEQSVVVKIPASSLPRGSYAIHLFRVESDGTEQRIQGSYLFDIE